jgi:hypothetical protein
MDGYGSIRSVWRADVPRPPAGMDDGLGLFVALQATCLESTSATMTNRSKRLRSHRRNDLWKRAEPSVSRVRGI